MTGTGVADVIVVGLGALGSAVLYQLARRGVRAIGIDRYDPPHALGSSHGESRITRLSVGEGEAYAPLVRRSHVLWREIEAEAGAELLLQTGWLLVAPQGGAARHHGKTDFMARTISVARRFDVPHEVLDSDGIAARFPQFNVRADAVGFFEPGAGLLFAERCVATQIRLAREQGAIVRTGERVGTIRQEGDSVAVVTDRGSIRANRVVVTAGPWLAGLMRGRFGALAKPYRQVLHWFTPENAQA